MARDFRCQRARFRHLDAPVATFHDFTAYERLIEAGKVVGPQEHLVVLLGGDAGLRCGEIQALEWTDIDLSKRRLIVQRSEWKGRRRRESPSPAPDASTASGGCGPECERATTDFDDRRSESRRRESNPRPQARKHRCLSQMQPAPLAVVLLLCSGATVRRVQRHARGVRFASARTC